MALINKLNAIGDAIREKTGKTDLLTLEQMPIEIAAIETGGGADTSMEDSLIEGTLTEYSNDRVTIFKTQAFNGMSSLVSISFPNVIKIESGSFAWGNLTNIHFPKLQEMNSLFLFNQCSNLTYADFPALKKINGGSDFANTGLATLILRNPTMCILSSGTSTFNNTPIANGTGYIYVPAALIEEYKAATNWVTYAAQFRAIEDYPDICG